MSHAVSCLARHRLLLSRTTTTVTAAAMSSLFFLDPFADRQFDDPAYKGTCVKWDKEDFCKRISEHVTPESLVPGYAPFCVHAFVPNFCGATVGVLPITAENRHLLESGYQARTPKELPVLMRWFPAANVTIPAAKFLDIIFYSREQLIKERAAMGDTTPVPPQPWGLISIKAQDEAHETPMQPITAMRNALGRDEGGSGVPLNREAYLASAQYFETHAMIQ